MKKIEGRSTYFDKMDDKKHFNNVARVQRRGKYSTSI
jgi:hypothetical protein